MRLAGVAPTSSSAPSLTGAVGSKVAVYILGTSAGLRTGRVLEGRPSAECQKRHLNSLIVEREWCLVGTYRDRLTGEKQSRPWLEYMISDAEGGRFQVVLVFSFACVADSLSQLVMRLDRLRKASVGFASIYEGLDSTVSVWKNELELIGRLAEFEAGIRALRITAGLGRAEVVGTKSGLPPGRPRVDLEAAGVCKLRREGLSQRQIAAELGVGLGTVHRVLKNNGH